MEFMSVRVAAPRAALRARTTATESGEHRDDENGHQHLDEGESPRG